MLIRKYLYVVVPLLLITPYNRIAIAEAHFKGCPTNTGTSASIILPIEVRPTIDGVLLADRTEIAVYSKDGRCAGAAIWAGNSVSITAWGDDVMTPAADGFASGESMTFRIWDPSSNSELSTVEAKITVKYDASSTDFRKDDRFASDAIYRLTTLKVERRKSNSTEMVVPLAVYPADGTADVDTSVKFEWSIADSTSTFDIQIFRAEKGDSMSTIISKKGYKGTTLDAELEEGTKYFWRIRAIVGAVKSEWSLLKNFQTKGEAATSSDDETLPTKTALNQNYPNPFNPDTIIPFELPTSVATRLTVVDMLGKEVAVLADRVMKAGSHQVRWDAADVPSGMYVYVLQTSEIRLTRTLILIK